MQTINLTKGNVLKAYRNADSTGKSMLADLCGNQVNFSENIMDLINDFGDILMLSGRTLESLINASDTPDEIAYKQAKLISYVYNGGDTLDAGDTSQYKYFPYHYIVKDSSKPSGFGLSYYGCGVWNSVSLVGVRLCFKDPKHAVDAGKKFILIYEKLKIR